MPTANEMFMFLWLDGKTRSCSRECRPRTDYVMAAALRRGLRAALLVAIEREHIEFFPYKASGSREASRPPSVPRSLPNELAAEALGFSFPRSRATDLGKRWLEGMKGKRRVEEHSTVTLGSFGCFDTARVLPYKGVVRIRVSNFVLLFSGTVGRNSRRSSYVRISAVEKSPTAP